MAGRMKIYLRNCLRELLGQSVDELLQARYQKFRRMGQYLENGATEQVFADSGNGHAAVGPHHRQQVAMAKPQ